MNALEQAIHRFFFFFCVGALPPLCSHTAWFAIEKFFSFCRHDLLQNGTSNFWKSLPTLLQTIWFSPDCSFCLKKKVTERVTIIWTEESDEQRWRMKLRECQNTAFTFFLLFVCSFTFLGVGEGGSLNCHLFCPRRVWLWGCKMHENASQKYIWYSGFSGNRQTEEV